MRLNQLMQVLNQQYTQPIMTEIKTLENVYMSLDKDRYIGPTFTNTQAHEEPTQQTYPIFTRTEYSLWQRITALFDSLFK